MQTERLAQVMPAAASSSETPYRANGALSILAGYSEENELVGYCVEVQAQGFGGVITMEVGVDLNGQVTGVAVTDHSESTGMGTMAMENAQLRKYVGMSGTIRTSGANSVDVVTGATATSEAITAGVNQALAIVANLETDGSVQYVDSDVERERKERIGWIPYNWQGWHWPPCCLKISSWSTAWASAPGWRPSTAPQLPAAPA